MKDGQKLLVIKTVRISQKLNSQINSAADLLDTAEQDIIRLCLRIGLGHLERVKYDLAKCVLDASGKAKK